MHQVAHYLDLRTCFFNSKCDMEYKEISLCSLNMSTYAFSLHGIWIYYPSDMVKCEDRKTSDEELPFAICEHIRMMCCLAAPVASP